MSRLLMSAYMALVIVLAEPSVPTAPSAPALPGSAALRAAEPSVATPPPSEAATATPIAATPDADVTGRADALVSAHAFAEALTTLGDSDEPTKAFLRARAWRGLGDALAAEQALSVAATDVDLAPLVAVETSLLALMRGDAATALAAVLQLLREHDPVSTPAIEPLAAALATSDPAAFVDNYDDFERLRRRDDADARSRLMGQKAGALQKLGKVSEAAAVERQRYLEEPVSLLTPEQPPEGALFTATERLARVEVLQDANRNERVVAALDALDDSELIPEQLCQKRLAIGLALRKLREYARSETELTHAVMACQADEERHRRALYLQAKVVSIRDGLRALPLMEAFVKRYPDHSMADDVLFWAGDILQRRGQSQQARAYYRRIDTLKGKDDYCLEARWRLAWMSYRQHDLAAAKKGLEAMLAGGCAATGGDKARGHYWLGRIAQARGEGDVAIAEYRQAFAEEAMGFYAQLALTRLAELDVDAAKALADTPIPAATTALSEECNSAIASEPSLARAERLLARGLASDASRVLLAIAPPAARVISTTHAAALGVTAKYVQRSGGVGSGDAHCGRDLRLHLALLLDRAGAYKDAHWRLRTEFSADLTSWPTSSTAALWRAAYPLAWHDEIAAAEDESHVPPMLLQALAREESAFDAQVVSWAGAYGLTQLLLSTARDAGKLLTPKITVARADDLLDARLNARLGGAFLASLIKHYRGSFALALAAYNSGTDSATAWWKRVGAEGLDVLGEEISIQETRGYVKRVLRTYGIYRWLYAHEVQGLTIAIAPANAPASVGAP